jgi:hypothetical protein
MEAVYLFVGLLCMGAAGYLSIRIKDRDLAIQIACACAIFGLIAIKQTGML